MLMDVETGELTFVEKDPENEVDFGDAVFHPETDELIATAYVGDRVRVYPKTDEAEKLWDEPEEGPARRRDRRQQHGPRHEPRCWSRSPATWTPARSTCTTRPPARPTLQYRSRPELPSEHLAHMKPVSYKARDGMNIHGYLTLPKGVEHKNLPVVMYIHGGPWARDYWGYEPYAQFLANRGYAVMQVNYRSSHRLRQELHERRQQGMGHRRHAARHHRRREVAHRRGHRRSRARSASSAAATAATPPWPA